MQVLLFSDIHCDLAAAQRLVEQTKNVEIVIGAGDFASQHEGLAEMIAVLKAIDRPTLLVAGNNETPEALTAACADWPSATVLHGTGAEINGIKFFGLGGGVPPTPWEWSYDLTEESAEDSLAECDAADVLILHSPPHGLLDGPDHMGSTAIDQSIRWLRPELAVCGHIHECWGEEGQIGPTRVVNPGPTGRVIELLGSRQTAGGQSSRS